MTQKIALIAALIAIITVAPVFAEPAQAGTCLSVTAKGVANIVTATKYVQDDLKQTDA